MAESVVRCVMRVGRLGTADVDGARLRWVNDTEPGIHRVQRGNSVAYLGVNGKRVQDADVLQRIRKLAIPPAYTDVWISVHANGHLQATGRDARGRKQYRYHADWHAERGQTKFQHLQEFGHVLPRIRAQVQRQLAGSEQPTRSRVLATLVRLLDTTWLRIGNDEYARSNKSFGLSTLRAKHAGVQGRDVRLSFLGKSGVRHEVVLSDRRIARIVRRCRDLPGQELFQYLDDDGSVHRIGSADVNAWLADLAGKADTHVTAKDFRTWHGSVEALELTLAACVAGGKQAEPPHTPQTVLAAVAKRLGNTPAVCRKAYIHPAVLELGEALADADARAGVLGRGWATHAPATRGLSAGERRLLALLREHHRPPRRAHAGTGVAARSV